MMMRLLAIASLLMAVTTAFTSHSTGRTVAFRSSTTPGRFMFNMNNNDGDKITPPAAPSLMDASAPEIMSGSTSSEQPKNYVRDMNTGEVREVKWVDPAMRANTSPLEMNWWAYALFGFPFLLLLNDALHFLPEDGLFGFFGRI